MPTYESIRYKITGANISGVLQASQNLNDVANNFDTHNLTVARNSHKIDGQTSDLTLATEGAGFALVYSGATYGWKLLEK